MNTVTDLVPFPLYHGTSSHYLSAFKSGSIPPDWPHKDSALNLLMDISEELKALGQEPDWYFETVLQRTSGQLNWQYGELYLTPSKLTAAKYARRVAKHGGELLTFCRRAIDTLGDLDTIRAESVMHNYEGLAFLLEGNGWPPLLVQFDHIRLADVSPETEGPDVIALVSRVANADPDFREIIGQQSNFRLASGQGRVGQVFELDIKDDDNPLPVFGLTKL